MPRKVTAFGQALTFVALLASKTMRLSCHQSVKEYQACDQARRFTPFFGGPEAHCRGAYPRRELVPVVDLVPGSIPERVQYANMEDGRMDCPWWLVLTVIPVKRSASLSINVP